MLAESAARSLTRRRAVAGLAVASGAWVSPSVLKLSRVGAAVGSCGAAVVQVDWTSLAPTTSMPPSVTANDGTIVSFSMSGSTGLLDPTYDGSIIADERGNRFDYMGFGMSNVINGDSITLTMSFSQPVPVCFELLDVDRSDGNWEDTVRITASVGGSNVPISSTDLTAMGGSVTIVPPNSALGVNSEPNDSDLSNVDFTAPEPIDSVSIQYLDASTWTSLQVIGIHDLRWC